MSEISSFVHLYHIPVTGRHYSVDTSQHLHICKLQKMPFTSGYIFPISTVLHFCLQKVTYFPRTVGFIQEREGNLLQMEPSG